MKFATVKGGLLLAAGVVFGFVLGCILMARYSAKVLEASEASEMAQTVGALYHLREHSLMNGIDVLENRADMDLMVLSESPGALDLPEVKRSVQIFREYRTKYPYANEDVQIRNIVTNLLSTVGTNSN